MSAQHPSDFGDFMVRILIFLAVLCAIGLGLAWMAERPGDIVLTWQGERVETSLLVGLGAVLALAVVVSLLFAILRFVLRLPSTVSLMAGARRRNKGMAALSRGMIAAGAGDLKAARRASAEADRQLPNEPISLLLKAQAAQMAGDRDGAESAFRRMADRPETRLLGLRGLHVEARRRGDEEAAHRFAAEAHQAGRLPWAGAAVLEYHAGRARWDEALAAVDANAGARLVDKATANRQRAALMTGIAMEKGEGDEALRMARAAVKLAPDLVPAVALASRLMSRAGDMRGASKIVERAWASGPHPDLAAAYVDVRQGDSAGDRLSRARALARLAPDHPESLYTVARASLNARDFAGVRQTLAPLVDDSSTSRPSVRVCMLMAELEERENGAQGRVREWLARASRAPRDAAWIADGVISDTWAPVSPVTGHIDAFVWKVPTETLGAAHASWTPEDSAAPAAPLTLSPAIAAPADIAPPDVPAEPAPPTEPTAAPASPQAIALEPAAPHPRPSEAAPVLRRAMPRPRPKNKIRVQSRQARLPAPQPAQPSAASDAASADTPAPQPAAGTPSVTNVPKKAGRVVFPLAGAPDDPGTPAPGAPRSWS